jgi:hypothetical protein
MQGFFKYRKKQLPERRVAANVTGYVACCGGRSRTQKCGEYVTPWRMQNMQKKRM